MAKTFNFDVVKTGNKYVHSTWPSGLNLMMVEWTQNVCF